MSKTKLTPEQRDAVMRFQPEIADLVERAHAAGVPRRWFFSVAAIQFQAIAACEEGLREKQANELRGQP